MTDAYRPETDDQVRDFVAWAVAEETPVELRGAGTKAGLGRPLQTDHTIDLSALSGITLYEAEELVLSAGAGTSLTDIQATLAAKHQQLAFEPPDFGPFYGGPAGRQTIGGVLNANLSGPRRIKAGAARDHFLGVTCITGRGDLVKSGGRVVKNVTGYDLCKVIAGSHGTLAALTSVTVKVLPAGEKTRTVLVFGLDDSAAIGAMTAALGSSHEVSGAAHLPADIAAVSNVSYVRDAGGPVTAVRVEGPGPSVEHRCAALRELLGARGAVEELHSRNSSTLWTEIGGLAPFVGDQESAVWRISVPPSAGASVVAAITAAGPARWFYDWGGGLIWLGVFPSHDARAAIVRESVDHAGGHATLVRAPASIRAAVPVFHPQPAALAALNRRIKESFDPNGVLNPGRMSAGA